MPSSAASHTCSVHQTELHHEPDGEHDGYGKKPLCEPCGELELVHDVLLSALGPDSKHIAPRTDPQQMQCLTVR
jgi:hypothetical protein